MRLISDYVVLSSAVIGVFLALGLGWIFYDTETNSISIEFRKHVDNRVTQLETSIALNMEGLYALKTLIEGSEEVTAKEFAIATHQVLLRHKHLESLHWATIKQTTQKDERETPATSPPSTDSEALVVEYSGGQDHSLFHESFDLYSLDTLKSLLKTSKSTLALISVSSEILSVDQQHPEAVHIFMPVLETRTHVNTSLLRGYVIAELDIHALIREVFSLVQDQDINLDILEESDGSTRSLYRSSSGPATSASGFDYDKLLTDIGGNRWFIKAVPSSRYIESRRTILPYAVFAFGVIFVLLGAAYVVVTVHHTQYIEGKVEMRTRELQKATHDLELLTRMDGLTGVANRRYFDEIMEREWARAAREQIPFTIIMLDIDHFKPFNDHYGHPAGDECLRQVAKTIEESFKRPSDMVARYGGEEFAIILPNTVDALTLAEDCRLRIQTLGITHEYSQVADKITVSVGVSSSIPVTGSDYLQLLNMADKALYKAKREGRNRTVSL